MKNKDEKSAKKMSSEIGALIARERAALESIDPRLVDGIVPKGDLKEVRSILDDMYDRLPDVYKALTVYRNGDGIPYKERNGFTLYVENVEHLAKAYNAGIADCRKAVYNQWWRDNTFETARVYDEGWLHENEMQKRMRINVISRDPDIVEGATADIKDIFPEMEY